VGYRKVRVNFSESPKGVAIHRCIGHEQKKSLSPSLWITINSCSGCKSIEERLIPIATTVSLRNRKDALKGDVWAHLDMSPFPIKAPVAKSLAS